VQSQAVQYNCQYEYIPLAGIELTDGRTNGQGGSYIPQNFVSYGYNMISI